MERDPQQELFTALKQGIEAAGYTVYDGALPPDGTPYPFVYLGDFQQMDNEHKGGVTGTVFPTVHIWGNDPKRRGTISRIALDVKTAFRRIGKTENFSWMVRNVNQRILADTSTAVPLVHCVINADFLFS